MENNEVLLKVIKNGEAIGAQMSRRPIEAGLAIGHACLSFANMVIEEEGASPKEAVEALFSSIGLYTLKAEALVNVEQRKAVLELRKAVDMYLNREEE